VEGTELLVHFDVYERAISQRQTTPMPQRNYILPLRTDLQMNNGAGARRLSSICTEWNAFCNDCAPSKGTRACWASVWAMFGPPDPIRCCIALERMLWVAGNCVWASCSLLAVLSRGTDVCAEGWQVMSRSTFSLLPCALAGQVVTQDVR
jgi:hypothetical protein